MNLNQIAEEINKLTSDEWEKLSKILKDEWGVYSKFSIVSYEEVENANINTPSSKDIWSIKLIDTGRNKLQVCKLTKEHMQLGLKEAKDTIDSAPIMILQGLSKDRAVDIIHEFEEAGAKMELI